MLGFHLYNVTFHFLIITANWYADMLSMKYKQNFNVLKNEKTSSRQHKRAQSGMLEFCTSVL